MYLVTFHHRWKVTKYYYSSKIYTQYLYFYSSVTLRYFLGYITADRIDEFTCWRSEMTSFINTDI